MATYAVPEDKLTAIADAIRLKRDTTTDMTLDDMPLQIALIEGGGGAEIKTGSFVGDGKRDLTIDTGVNDFNVLIIFNPDYWANRKTVAYALNGVCFVRLSSGKYLIFACMDNFNATGLQGGDGSDAVDLKSNGKPCMTISGSTMHWYYVNSGGNGLFRNGQVYQWLAF